MNEQMHAYTYRKSPWRLVFAVAALLAAAKLLWPVVVGIFVWLYTGYVALTTDGFATSIGIIGGADGPTAIFLTTPLWVEPVLTLAVLAVGLGGWYALSHLKKK